ncbi:MAG: hypothetical protein D6698_08575, partial [Gammaproteobacteria bacterium]
MKGPCFLYVLNRLTVLVMLLMIQGTIAGQNTYDILAGLADDVQTQGIGKEDCAGEESLTRQQALQIKYTGKEDCSRRALMRLLHEATLAADVAATLQAYTDLGEHYWYFESFQNA